jgi:hypothetical protein
MDMPVAPLFYCKNVMLLYARCKSHASYPKVFFQTSNILRTLCCGAAPVFNVVPVIPVSALPVVPAVRALLLLCSPKPGLKARVSLPAGLTSRNGSSWFRLLLLSRRPMEVAGRHEETPIASSSLAEYAGGAAGDEGGRSCNEISRDPPLRVLLDCPPCTSPAIFRNRSSALA